MVDPLGFLQVFAMPEPLTLTFGIELEFVLRVDLKDHLTLLDDDDDDNDESYEETMNSVRDHFFNLLTKRFPRSTGLVDFGVWEVGTDESIEADGPPFGPQDVRRYGDYDYIGIELRSPALPYTAESLVKIGEMCWLLGKFDILVNESCGLHVHVGNERKGFPLETIKNLCILTATFERELESLHPPHRIGNFFTESTGSLFDGISPRVIRRMIKKAETVSDLIQLVQKGEKRHAYNLLNLEFPMDLQTFEFRQHEAIIDADAITKWVELTCGLVDKAHQFAVQDHLGVGMDVYINQMSSVPQLNIIKVLTSLGLEDVASYYDRRGLVTHPRALWSRADPNYENAMTAWVRPENAMTPWVRPENSVFLDGKQTVKTVVISKENRQRYEQAVGEYDAETPVHDPRGSELGAAGSEERAHDSSDCFDTASTKVPFFSWSMPVERLSTSQPIGPRSRTTSSTLPIMTRSIPTTAEIFSLSRKDLLGRAVSAPDMANYTALTSPIRKIRTPVSFNHTTATLAARSRGVSALPLRLICALGYIPKLASLSRAVKPTWSALSVAPKSTKQWTASTSDW